MEGVEVQLTCKHKRPCCCRGTVRTGKPGAGMLLPIPQLLRKTGQPSSSATAMNVPGAVPPEVSMWLAQPTRLGATPPL